MLDAKKIVELNKKIVSIMQGDVKDCQKIKEVLITKKLSFSSDYESILPHEIRKSIDDRTLITYARGLVAVEDQIDQLEAGNGGPVDDILFKLDISKGLPGVPTLMNQNELTEVLNDFKELKKKDVIKQLSNNSKDANLLNSSKIDIDIIL